MKDKALNFLGLMRKANAIQIGETDTGAAARAMTAKLVILAKDASDNARSRAKGFVYGRNIPMIVSPFTKDEISEHVGKPGCSMAAITDTGFADAFMKTLVQISDEYAPVADAISLALQKEKQRKKEKSAHDRNKKIGKRRNNA